MPAFAQTSAWSEAVMEVALQGQAEGDTLVVLRGSGGELYLDEEEFNKLRLRLPQVQPHEHAGRRYYPLSAIRGCTVSIDEVRQRALISAPARAFETTMLAATDRQHPPLSPASPGAFLNYQLCDAPSWQNTAGADAEHVRTRGRPVVPRWCGG